MRSPPPLTVLSGRPTPLDALPFGAIRVQLVGTEFADTCKSALLYQGVDGTRRGMGRGTRPIGTRRHESAAARKASTCETFGWQL